MAFFYYLATGVTLLTWLQTAPLSAAMMVDPRLDTVATGRWTGRIRVNDSTPWQTVRLDLTVYRGIAANLYGEWPSKNIFGFKFDTVSYYPESGLFALNYEYDVRILADHTSPSKNTMRGFWRSGNDLFELEMAKEWSPGDPEPAVDLETVPIVNRSRGVTLSSTFSLPTATSPPYPVVIWVNGYSASDADLFQERNGRPLAVLSEILADSGIAMVRWDDRESTRLSALRGASLFGDRLSDLSRIVDVVKAQPWVDTNRILLIGFEEGAAVAARIASAPVRALLCVSAVTETGCPEIVRRLAKKPVSQGSGIDEKGGITTLEVAEAVALTRLCDEFNRFRASVNTAQPPDILRDKAPWDAIKFVLGAYSDYAPNVFADVQIPVTAMWGAGDPVEDAFIQARRFKIIRGVERADADNIFLLENVRRALRDCELCNKSVIMRIAQWAVESAR